MFAPGDEVVAVGAPADVRPWQERHGDGGFSPNEVYIVEAVIPFGSWVGLVIAGHPSPSPHYAYSWDAVCFRKVQKRPESRNLTEWLSQPSGYDEEQQNPAPKAPAKKRERSR